MTNARNQALRTLIEQTVPNALAILETSAPPETHVERMDRLYPICDGWAWEQGEED